MNPTQQYKYFAFISYSSKDLEWGKRVQRKLEHYRMPATLCSEHGWERTPIKPVFFAPTDIQPGGLTAEIQERLRSSRNLIVIGSTNSAQSEWVGKEIEFFHQIGRTEQIHYFIVSGQPNSGDITTECYNPILKKLGIPEILGANIHENIYRWSWLNKERAYVQLISKLLGVEFDAIWRRHRLQLIQKAVACTIGILAVLAALLSVWFTSQPVDVEVRLNEASVHNPNLPPLKDAIITLDLENEVKTDTIRSLHSSTIFKNIPHRYINNNVRVRVECFGFLPVDTTMQLSKAMSINIHRNPKVYGDLRFRLWNPYTEEVAANAMIVIDGQQVISDASGYVTLTIPLPEQKKYYTVRSDDISLDDSVFYSNSGPDAIMSFK